MALSPDQFEQFIDRLSQQAAHFSKSMKFAKLVLAVLTKHQSSVSRSGASFCGVDYVTVVEAHGVLLSNGIQSRLRMLRFSQ